MSWLARAIVIGIAVVLGGFRARSRLLLPRPLIGRPGRARPLTGSRRKPSG
jgi:hypothetical protein